MSEINDQVRRALARTEPLSPAAAEAIEAMLRAAYERVRRPNRSGPGLLAETLRGEPLMKPLRVDGGRASVTHGRQDPPRPPLTDAPESTAVEVTKPA